MMWEGIISASERPLPLDGVRVLDLSRALSGPFCSMILGDLGADIIKVEPAPEGDLIRAWGPFDRGESVYYLSTNHNKRSLGVDFRNPQGLALLRELALKSDVVVENFRPGAMASMGMDPQQLFKENGRLVIGSISGFGSEGPLAQQPGFDQIAQGYSGLMSFTGEKPEGTRVGIAIGDLAAGMWLAIAVLSALVARGRDGKGQIIETSLLAGLMSLLSVQGQRYLSLGEIPKPTGNVHPVISPYGIFRTKDGNLNIGAATQKMFLQLCDVVGLPDLKTDPRFADNARRVQVREQLRDILEERLITRTRAEWTKDLVAVGIPAGPINNVGEAFAEEQTKFLNVVEEFRHPLLAMMKQVTVPITTGDFSGRRIKRPPPLFAEHSREVLAAFGYPAGAIDELIAAGAVTQR